LPNYELSLPLVTVRTTLKCLIREDFVNGGARPGGVNLLRNS
jgi:hypothetical protein